MEQPVRNYTTNEYKLISNGNLKLSKKFYPKGTNQIKLNSMNVIEDDVILRGDLGVISIGSSTIIDKEAIIRPCLSSPIPPFMYKHVKIGSSCYIGKKAIISAISIGNNSYIGENCVLVS